MSDVLETIKQVLLDIQQANEYPTIPLELDKKITKDLGFSSLDVAELIANLELEFGVDPFAEEVSLMDVHTIGELQTVYEQALQKNG